MNKTTKEFAAITGGYFGKQMKSVKPTKYTQRPHHIEEVMALTMRYIETDHPVVSAS